MKPVVISVAPMLDYTDRHYRYLTQYYAPHVTLYTEMIVSTALMHGENARLLLEAPQESTRSPVILQLGGSDPQEMAQCAALANRLSFSAININVGCPSDRVKSGRFGACLMREPKRIAACVKAMKEVTALPVTIKTRLGVDHDDSYEFLQDFIETVVASGVDTFILHARKAWLNGLNPKQNREIPPLNYERVYQIKRAYPSLDIQINGGIETLEQVLTHANHVDGIMIGRAAYHHPNLLIDIEREIYGHAAPSLREIIDYYFNYLEQEILQQHSIGALLKPLMPFMHGKAGARQWRYLLSHGAKSMTLTELRQQLESIL